VGKGRRIRKREELWGKRRRIRKREEPDPELFFQILSGW
jgi:hypothetical protein